MTNKEKFLQLVGNTPVSDTVEKAKERQRNRAAIKAKQDADLTELENQDKNKTMKTEIQTTEKITNATEMEVAVGYEVSQLLNLKFSKDGRTNTSWGTKSVQGLGACILRIIEEQKERLA